MSLNILFFSFEGFPRSNLAVSENITTWLCFMQFFCTKKYVLINTKFLTSYPRATLTRIVLVQKPEVTSLVVTRASVPHVYGHGICLRCDGDISGIGVNYPVKFWHVRNLLHFYTKIISILDSFYFRQHAPIKRFKLFFCIQ